MLSEQFLQFGGLCAKIGYCVRTQLYAGKTQSRNIFDRLPVIPAPRNRGIAEANRSGRWGDALIEVRKVSRRIERPGSSACPLLRRKQFSCARFSENGRQSVCGEAAYKCSSRGNCRTAEKLSARW